VTSLARVPALIEIHACAATDDRFEIELGGWRTRATFVATRMLGRRAPRGVVAGVAYEAAQSPCKARGGRASWGVSARATGRTPPVSARR
jgi:hypothetical protein